jgi:hypothetical protein
MFDEPHDWDTSNHDRSLGLEIHVQCAASDHSRVREQIIEISPRRDGIVFSIHDQRKHVLVPCYRQELLIPCFPERAKCFLRLAESVL